MEAFRDRHRHGLDFLFYLGFALLACHELDAVAQAEWRLLPGLDQLSDSDGLFVFVLLHVPLLAVLMWLVSHPSPRVRERARWTIDAFMVVHVGLHLSFHDHEAYSFHGPLSQALIYGAGVVGFAHLTLTAGPFARRT